MKMFKRKEKRIFKIDYIQLANHTEYIIATSEHKALKKFYRKHINGFHPNMIDFTEVKLGKDGKFYAL